MDKLIHTALNSLNSARIRQNVSSQNLSNAQVPGFRGDEIGGRFGSIFLESDSTLSTRVFTKEVKPVCFPISKANYDKQDSQAMWQLLAMAISLSKGKVVNLL